MNIFYRGVTHLTRFSTVTLVGGNSLCDAARKMIPFCSSKLIFQSSFSSGCQSSFPYGSSLLSRQLTLPGVPQIKERPMLSSNTLYNISKRMASLEYMHRRGKPLKIKRKKKNPLGFGIPFAKGVVLKTLIRKPKKPNSANRKCVLVRLSSGKEMIAFVPGEGHNLQEHSVVLVRPGRLRDTPGVKIRCIRGKYDLPHVVKKKA